MARLIPELHAVRVFSGGSQRERDVLALLAHGLPDDWTVVHSVNWSSLHPADGSQRFGEIDAVVLAPWGHVLLMEVKAGAVAHGAAGLGKQYGGKLKSVDSQARVQFSSMRQNLNNAGLQRVYVAQLLVFPDQRVASGTAAHPRERIVDASEYDQLCRRVQEAIPYNQGARGDPQATAEQVLAFLLNQFALTPDVSAQTRHAAVAVRHLSQGLATWVPRMEGTAGVYVVQATAGSGKTQLALALLARAQASGQQAAYVCFNRPLADHMKAMAAVTAPAAQVCTFHTWALGRARAAHLLQGPLDYEQPDTFRAIAQAWLSVADNEPADLDVLVIDESQDFDASWVQGLLGRLKPGSRLYVLGDTNQALYPVEPYELVDGVRIVCNDNFRSPRQLVHLINRLRLTDEVITPAGDTDGDPLDVRICPGDDAGGIRTTEAALQDLWRVGYKPEQVVVLSWRGRKESAVLQCDRLAGFRTRRWLSTYTAAGEPLYSAGVLNVDSVHRYKGQSAPAVVLTGLDFTELNVHHRHLLFVALTRAQLKLVLVATEAAVATLEARIRG
jgi:AAA domain/UvrD-like helicase C-terminal domain/Nuclease-related domain